MHVYLWLEPVVFLKYPVIEVIAVLDAVVVYSYMTDSTWEQTPELCRRARPVPQIMTVVFLHLPSTQAIVALQAQKVMLGRGPSFTGMEHWAPHAIAVHIDTGL